MIEDPKQGLPDPVFDFVRKVTPLINVDLLVRDGNKTLLAWRVDAYGEGWHIPGGIIRFFEPLEKRIAEVARTELGSRVTAEASPCDIRQFFHPRGHFISLLYRCTLNGGLGQPEMLYRGGEKRSGMLAWIEGVPADIYPVHLHYSDWLGANTVRNSKPAS